MPADQRRVIVKADLATGYSLAEVQSNVEAKWNLAQIYSYELLKISPASMNAETQRFNFHYSFPQDKAALAQELANTLPGTSGTPVVAAEPLTIVALDPTSGIEADFFGDMTGLGSNFITIQVLATNEFGVGQQALGQLMFSAGTPTGEWTNIRPNPAPAIYDHTLLKVVHSQNLMGLNQPTFEFDMGIVANSIKIKPQGGTALDISHGKYQLLRESGLNILTGDTGGYGGVSPYSFYVNEFGKLLLQSVTAHPYWSLQGGDTLERQLIIPGGISDYVTSSGIGEYWVGDAYLKLKAAV